MNRSRANGSARCSRRSTRSASPGRTAIRSRRSPRSTRSHPTSCSSTCRCRVSTASPYSKRCRAPSVPPRSSSSPPTTATRCAPSTPPRSTISSSRLRSRASPKRRHARSTAWLPRCATTALDERLLSALRHEHRTQERFPVWDGDGLQLVRAADIRWCEAERNYVRLHVATAAHLLRSTLHDLERRLDPERFVRVHRSSIVNVEHLTRLEPWFHGEYVAFLSDGARVRVSRTYSAHLRGTRRRPDRLLHRRVRQHLRDTGARRRLAILPSPTPDATRFTESLRTSPAAKMPGMLVSSANGRRSSVHVLEAASGQEIAARRRSLEVLAAANAACASALMNMNSPAAGRVCSPPAASRVTIASRCAVPIARSTVAPGVPCMFFFERICSIR